MRIPNALSLAFAISALLFAGCRTPVSHPHFTIVGKGGCQLSKEDIANVEHIVKDNGEQAWLLDAPRGQVADWQLVVAYCSPRISTHELRRGFVVAVRRPLQASTNTWGEWTLVGKGFEYAQVRIPGRDFDRIESEQDSNRPFRILSPFADAELVSIAKLVRSAEAILSAVTNCAFGTVTLELSSSSQSMGSDHFRSISKSAIYGRAEYIRMGIQTTLPILTVTRESNGSVNVMFRKDDWSGQAVVLRQQGKNWVIVSVGIWMA
ncbi:MAG: hypothetical protein EXS31_12700 [Pedosphaera sp.]|nr:hypothetical protein [Pedosphaera sp.]